jgi:hypothetical protein
VHWEARCVCGKSTSDLLRFGRAAPGRDWGWEPRLVRLAFSDSSAPLADVREGRTGLRLRL